MERFLDYFIPEYYWLELYVFRKKRIIRGTVTVDGESKSDHIKFHGTNLKITSVSFQARSWMGRSYYEEDTFTPCPYEYDGKELKISLTSEMRMQLAQQVKTNYDEDFDDRNMVSFRIEYEAPINSNMEGCYLSSYDYDGETREIIATQFESHYAREAFPCIDEPAAKAEFHLVLLTPDITPGDVVLANMPLEHKDQNRYTFATTPRMSTYLLAWVIGPLQSISTVNKDGIRVSSYCTLSQPLESLLFANQTAMRALEYYCQKFDTKYPLPKLDQVALPDFEAGAMENWGLVTYRESMMLAAGDASADTKRKVATTVTHELSHQWFGNLVTMRWWDDLWLNESFATIMEYYAADAIYPKLRVWEDFFTNDCFAALQRDCLPGVQAVKQAVHNPAEIATLFDSAIVYAKGARLVLMLIRLMGEERFYDGIKYYFERYKYENTVGDDLWCSLQPYADFDIKSFMNAWISQPGYPELIDGRERRFLITGETDSTKWPLPKIEDDMSGHYLINLNDTDFLQKLSNFETLSTEQQLRLLIDRLLPARTPEVASDSLLDLLPKFASTTSAAVLQIVGIMISDLKLFCPPADYTQSASSLVSAVGDYKKFLASIFYPRFASLDYGSIHDADAVRTRDLILGIAYYVEDSQVLEHLASLYQSDFSQIDPELRPHVLAAKFRQSESEVFTEWLERYQSETDPDIKHTLLAILAGYAKQPAHLGRLITLLRQTDIVRPQDHIFLYIYLLRNYRTRQLTLEWLTKNWDFVVKLSGDKSLEDYPRYAANFIQTQAEAQIFYDFFATKSNEPALARSLKIAHVAIDARLALIKQDTTGVKTKLSALLKTKSQERK